MENTLFNETTIKRLVEGIKLTAKQKKASQEWLNLMEKGELMKEKRRYFDFKDIILRDILGYEKLEHEKDNVEFTYEQEGKPIIRIEAKGMDTPDLFLPQKRAREESPAEQVWRYMNKFATPYGIVTNYRLFVLFKYDVGNTKYYLFDFEEIKRNPDELKEFVAIFSKESVDSGFVDKLHKESIIEEREFTKEFYKLYHETRLMLIREFENNTDINKDASVHFAQIFLNRLMFVFFAEDTGKIDKRVVEDRILGRLRDVSSFSTNSKNISDNLVTLFKDLDKGSDFPTKLFGFNGGLFKHPIPDRIHFRDFRDSKLFKDIYQNSKLKSKDLELNEKEKEIFEKYKNKLNPIIKNLLLMASFDFKSEVNVNILGHIFEQSISDIEELKTDKTSRRKKEGIFYTPEYITSYICRNTIIPYLSERGATTTYDLIKEYANNIENLEKKFKEMKILDPACGSGAFLIKATDVMLEIFKAIQEFKEQEGEYQAQRGLKKKSNHKGQLVLTKWNEEEEAREIIENNIFGVDINEESVEITKLSLFLKMARKNRKLTDLSNNIKQGNSLIDNEEIAGKLAFNWEEQFKEIMSNGGFDVVIGNPPYVRPHNLDNNTKKYLWEKSKVYKAKGDLYASFIEKGINLTKEKGKFSFIVPHTWMGLESFDKLRGYILNNCMINSLVVLPKKVFESAIVETMIFNFQKSKDYDKKENKINILEMDLTGNIKRLGEKNQSNYYPNKIFDLSIGKKSDILVKIKKDTKPLSTGVNFYYGLKTADDNKFLTTNPRNNIEYKKLLRRSDFGRYTIKFGGEYVWYKPDLMRENKKTSRPGEPKRFENPKIIIMDIAKKIVASYDNNNYYIKDALILHKKDNFDLAYILTILNSKLISYYYKEKYLVLSVAKNAFLELPIKIISVTEQKPFIEKADLM
ncbi:MAG: N-6 DNA methylase, partial [Nanoarchaeota archaeon]|nr:N-6 DNA methylase [Nanoarchaeota archaeon]